ncbi:siderophore-interacting protein [Streptomyces sp. H27-D2]|uniref:siderophore-interacting protein n=1 Tax=Streptomyces sp. H27-D2 TaxID=3046304 RepID=UPI002DB84004|nr:siderophore-interacting protein [Streptomyces sp. H27-D2]MEC4016658.1 siderophore-interacting protein [Streptomyces sp. H27-D2]
MADRPARKKPQLNRAQVVRTEQLTPHMVRVVLGGGNLADFGAGDCTDHYIKLLFLKDGVDYPEPLDMEAVRRDMPRDQWPVTRTYTVRSWDPKTRELAVDFVVHGDSGLAGPWAAGVKPGAEVLFLGPGGEYAPRADADWHLLVGDESALPAIAAALERLSENLSEAPVRVFIEVAGQQERQALTVPAGAEIVWLHRDGSQAGDSLVSAVRAMPLPPGRVQAFVHGEAGFVKELRRWLRVEREVPRERLSISGYWRRGHDEDGWQASKREWNQQVEAEQENPEQENRQRTKNAAGVPANS